MAEQFKAVGDNKVRYDWYQTETNVIINVLHKNIDATLLDVRFEPSSVTIALPGVDGRLSFDLSHNVRHENCSFKVTPSKLEIRLSKVDGNRWEKLEGAVDTNLKSIPKAESSSDNSTTKKSKNWDEVVKNEEVEENDPLNELFKKIYAEGSDEVRKAMNKSFMESGGTVLSTNWNEVKTDKVDIKPPEGMEWKKWDSS